MNAGAPYRSEAFAEDLFEAAPEAAQTALPHDIDAPRPPAPGFARLLLWWPLALALSAGSVITLLAPLG